MATKRVDYRVFDGKYCIYTVKNNVLEGFLVSMFELASGTGPSKISRKHCHKTIIYIWAISKTLLHQNGISSFPSLERVTFVLQGFGKHTCSIMQSPLRVSGSSNGKSKNKRTRICQD